LLLLTVFIIATAGISHAQVNPEQKAAPAATENAPFGFTSGLAAYDGAYEKARRVIAADVNDGKFLAGQNWAQVWTRATS